jgi:FtsH-binding integral membrane protein
VSGSGGDLSRPRPGQREARQHEAGPGADGREHRRERVREGVTMALYISLSLLAVLVALPPALDPGAGARPALTLFLTSLGLILAHALAFRLSARLVHRGALPAAQLELLAAQLAGGLAVTAVAVAPVLLLGGPDGVRAAEWLLLAFVAVVGYLAARAVPLSRPRALAYVAAVVALTLGVLLVKSLVHH